MTTDTTTETINETTPMVTEEVHTEATTEHVEAQQEAETQETQTEESTPTEFTEQNQSEHIAKTFDLDLDFENFTVPEERATAIRNLMSDIKAKTWMATLKDWVAAEGQVYYPFGEQTEMGETPAKRIHWEAGHALETLELINDGVDTEIKIEGKKYLTLQKLPKGDEILLSQFNPEFTSKFKALETELHASLKVFLKAKAEKTKAFQERFKKQS
ncbi:MAG: hypothetical protein R3A80_08570 [Bdellovibrionota bacterium]